MTAAEVLDRLKAAGVRLEAQGNGLAAHHAGPLAEEQADLIRSHKDELLAHLTGRVTALNTPHHKLCGCAMCLPDGLSARWLRGELA